MFPFNQIYILSLERRKDRLKQFQEQWGGKFPNELTYLFAAYDGTLFPVPFGFNGGPGVWGCMQSHRRILENAILKSHSSILVFEDDAVPHPEWTTRFPRFVADLPSDWEMLMIGGQHNKAPAYFKPGIVRCLNTARTHCYAVRGEMIRTLYQHLHSPSARTHCDHLICALHSGHRVYAPVDFLAGQAAGQSDIENTPTRENFWHPSQMFPASATGIPVGKDGGQ